MYHFYFRDNEGIMSHFIMEKSFNDVFKDYIDFERVGLRAWIYDAKGNLVCGREDM